MLLTTPPWAEQQEKCTLLVEIKLENKQAKPQQERCGRPADLLSSLCLGPNQPVGPGSQHCATGVTLREGRLIAKHLFLWSNQVFSSVNRVFHPWADNTAREQTSALLSLPCPYSYYHHPSAQNAAGKKVPAPRGNRYSCLRMGKRGRKTGKKDMRTSLEHVRAWDDGWLSPCQLPGQTASLKTRHCTFTFPLSFSPSFHSYKTNNNTPCQLIPPSPVQISALPW